MMPKTKLGFSLWESICTHWSGSRKNAMKLFFVKFCWCFDSEVIGDCSDGLIATSFSVSEETMVVVHKIIDLESEWR